MHSGPAYVGMPQKPSYRAFHPHYQDSELSEITGKPVYRNMFFEMNVLRVSAAEEGLTSIGVNPWGETV